MRPPLLKDPPSSSLVIHNNSVEEKPKATTKFSRFEDSDSDDSDDIEMSYAKSESEEEEFVVEEGDAEDLIIEVEDEVIIEEFIEEEAEPLANVASVPQSRVEISTSDVKTSEKQSSLVTRVSTPPPPLRTQEVAKEEPLQRDVRSMEFNRKEEDFSRRSPKSNSARSSPLPRRRSPTRQQRTPPRPQKSPSRMQRSPLRSQRSPQRTQRSPPRIQRSPVRTQRSPARIPRSPARTQRSPVRPLDRSKPKSREISKTSSGSDRSGSDETRKIERARATTDPVSSRLSDLRRTADKSRSPTNDRKPLLRRSPLRPTPSERESRKVGTASPSDADRDRLESRKRKFEMAQDQEPAIKKEGKIRLRGGEVSRKTPPVQLRRKEEKPKRSEPDHVQVRRTEPITMIQDKADEEDDDKMLKKSKRSNKKSKEKSRNGKPQSGSELDNGNFAFVNVRVNKRGLISS